MQEVKRNDFIVLVIATSVLFGLMIRLIPAIRAGSPINDGGLFLQMTRELQVNHYKIPLFTGYNQLNIPFVYPPLGFFLTAFVQVITGIDLFTIFRYLPPILATLTIPAMFFLASLVLKDRLRGAITTFFYAVIPVSFSALIMGGGVPRTLGIVFSLLLLGFLYLLITTQSTKYILPVTVCAALVVLSHPEATYHAFITSILFWMCFGRNRKSLVLMLASALLALFLTAPWWVYALQHHGLAPFLSAIGDQPRDSFFLLYMFQFNLTGEALLTVVGVFAALGLLICLLKREWFLPAWILLSFLTSQRAGPYGSEFPIALLAFVGFEFIVGKSDLPLARLYNSRIHLGAFLVLVIYCLAASLTAGLRIAYEQRITPEDRVALNWVSNNTTPNSHFMVLTGESSPANDPVSEWFPALTGRISLATIQGHEWLQKESMTPAWFDYLTLQSCLNAGPICVEEWGLKKQAEFSYIYIRKISLQADGSVRPIDTPLEILLRASTGYQVVYDSPAAVIFQASTR